MDKQLEAFTNTLNVQQLKLFNSIMTHIGRIQGENEALKILLKHIDVDEQGTKTPRV